MSERKYSQGKPIRSVAEFEQYDGTFFVVKFGNRGKTIHRAFLISWQYGFLKKFIEQGWVFEAIKDDKQQDDRNCFFCHNFKVCKEKGTIVRVTTSRDIVERYIPGLHNDCLTWFRNPPLGKERDNHETSITR